MKRTTCDICMDTIFDRCQWHWTLRRETLMGDRQKLHICPTCATALIDVIMEKRHENEGAPVDGGESYT